MEVIVISPQNPIMGEHDTMLWMFENGLDRYHVRREGDENEVKKVINRIPKTNRGQASLHQAHHLSSTYTPCGIHHKSDGQFDPSFSGTQSKSFHDPSAIISETNAYAYGFYSPVFPSISKPGYENPQDVSVLKSLNEESPFPLIALGGICPENIKDVKKIGFKGVALYGTIWQQVRWTKIEDNFKRIIETCKG